MSVDMFDLDKIILRIPDGGGLEPFSIRQACTGVSVMGSTGSGKSSGSLRTLTLNYMKSGFGGLILTVKPFEKETILEYCRLTGRTDDLVIIEPGGSNYFDFMGHISAVDKDESFAANVVEALKTVLQSGSENGKGADDSFWDNAMSMTLLNIVNLCQLAYGKVSMKHLYEIALTMPKKPENAKEDAKIKKPLNAYDKAFIAAREKVNKLKSEFIEKLPEDKDWMEIEHLLEEAVPQLRIMQQVDQFFFEALHGLASRTRSIIDFTILGFLFNMLQEPIYSIFCRNKSTFTPSDCYTKGKILLINLPVKKYHKAGRDCQILMKYIFQRDMEKRNVNEYPRPVFIIADESQHFIHRHDTDFQATARSSRVATMYATQNISAYFSNMGGQSEYRVKAFLATLTTHIFHSNIDHTTNQFASDMIGQGWQQEKQTGNTIAGEFSSSENAAWHLRHMVRPEQFGINMLTGGAMVNYKVSAYIYMQGAQFSNGYPYKLITFNQNYTPQINPL